ncbi:hypothetical protein IT408_03550 [Candidatus Uhrbacteria bacterium]|nr:hypothetical protein [Candidatus Uhrbacteria bacterium]
MLPTILTFIVSLFTLFGIPWIADQSGFKKMTSRTWLIIACCLYAISWYLPQPLIQGQNTMFMTHFIGGGFFTTCIWIHLFHHWTGKKSILLELISIFALISMLGVANELFELFISQIGLVNLDPSDTWWDLLANTLGAYTLWFFYSIGKSLKAKA